jgi:hypothetical protein
VAWYISPTLTPEGADENETEYTPVLVVLQLLGVPVVRVVGWFDVCPIDVITAMAKPSQHTKHLYGVCHHQPVHQQPWCS